ncbi:MAG TPA: hypothetical protein VNQ73_06800 [Ilumatobacter sp.]|nr:hypothetical protein [Ilumatobacter sp.]
MTATTIVAGAMSLGLRADGATIVGEYAEGYRDVSINGYGTPGLGTFRLRDGDTTVVALCIEADVRHSTGPDAYVPVPNQSTSDELDVLLWWVGRHTPLDADTATAAAALAWYYTDAQRRGGGAVWADSARGWAPIGPLSPHPWDGPLPRYGLSFPVGLRSGTADLDAAEAKVAALHRGVQNLRGAWRIVWDTGAFVVTVAGQPIAGQPVQLTVLGPDGAELTHRTVLTDTAGRAAVGDVPAGGTARGAIDTPGVHREWDGPDIQRLATPGVAWLTAEFAAPTPTTSTTTTSTTTTTTIRPTQPTTTTTTTTTTTVPPTTAPPTTVPPTTVPPTTVPETSPPTTVPPTRVPPTTAPETTTSTTTTLPPTTTTTTTIEVQQMAPPPPPPPSTPLPTPAPTPPIPTLPATGPSDVSTMALRVADATFVGGVLLVAVSMLGRRTTHPG